MRDVASLFQDRQTAGEFLYFAGRFELGTIVVGLTPGSVELGFPTAFLTGGELRHLPLARVERGARLDMELAGRRVVLADDGLTPLPHLLAAARLLEAAGPARLVLVAPWVSSGFAEDLGPSSRIELLTLRRGPLPVLLPFYEEAAPKAEKIAWCFQAVEGVRYDPDLAAVARSARAAVEPRLGDQAAPRRCSTT